MVENQPTALWGSAHKSVKPTPPKTRTTENQMFTSSPLLDKLREKKEPTLGELNPLLYRLDILNPEAVEAMKLVISRKIAQYRGLFPNMLQPGFVPSALGPEPRLFVRYEIDTISENQISLLESLVRRTYGTSVRTRTNTKGESITPSGYPDPEKGKSKKKNQGDGGGKLVGWYMGPNTSPVDSSHQGLFVYRDLGEVGMANYLKSHNHKEWFLNPNLVNPITGRPLKTSYLVEIREAGLYQTDLAEFVTQASFALGIGELIEHRRLLYELYNDLNRLGLKKADRGDIYGLDGEIDRVNRVLILPLANLDLSSGIALNAGSAILTGVPGTGKTLIAEYLLQQDSGIFFLPLDPLQLAQDLASPPEKKRILPRVSEVFNQTGIPIVIHIDDIENIAQNEQQINSTLLNLMAGVRECGFFVLASTNFPEKLTPQLIQPQRFAHVIYTGLPSEEARRGILDIHATRVSRELGKPLFTSDDERDIILSAIAKLSVNFTPRYLAETCTEAKSFYLQRLAQRAVQASGLTEEDLDDTFSVDDWVRGYAEANKKYDMEATVKRDKELREFARNYYRRLGFDVNHKGQEAFPLKTVIEERLAATRQANRATESK